MTLCLSKLLDRKGSFVKMSLRNFTQKPIMNTEFSVQNINVLFRGNVQPIAYWQKSGQKPPLVYLHGLGCAKDDFYTSAQFQLPGAPALLAFDFPGCGSSPLKDGQHYNIDDLVEFTDVFLKDIGAIPAVIIGHSMGGLIGLLLAEKYPEDVRAFINIEGNLSASDCFFSRRIAAMNEETFCMRSFKKYVGRLKLNTNFGLSRHAEILERFSNPRAMYDVAPSLVAYSDTGQLLNRFLKLKVPTSFIYGSENASLPYIGQLQKGCIRVCEIAKSNHFPHQDNPHDFYMIVAKALAGLKEHVPNIPG